MPEKLKKNKSLFLAYLLWLFGGFFGLHHFYLGRDLHAFITFCTLGGYFGAGLIRDLWRLPEYTADANNDREYLDKLHDQIRKNARPPSSVCRSVGMMILGNIFAYLTSYAIPQDIIHPNIVIAIRVIIMPFASALGVWMVGNVGRHQGVLWKPLLASYISVIVSLFIGFPFESLSTLAASLTFTNFSKEWRKVPTLNQKKSLIHRISLLTILTIIYLSLWASWLYHGCTIEDPETNEIIKCRVAWDNFLKSPAYSNLYEAFEQLYMHVKHNGFSTLWEEIIQEFDVSGKNSALTLLGLDESATPEEILARYKKLSREFHPDREKNESKKQEKQEMFIQIQEAFRTLEVRVNRNRPK